MLEKFMNSIMLPKKIALSSLFVVACTFLVGFIIFVEIPVLSTAKECTDGLGKETGKAAGIAQGTLDALAASEDIKKNALDDATLVEIEWSDIKNSFINVTNLELLSTDIIVHYTWEYGKDVSYAELFTLTGKGVFFTDLSKADVKIENQLVYVTISTPSLEVYFDGTPKSIAKYEHLGLNLFTDGSAANAGYLNQRSEAVKEIKEKMCGYDGLLEQSKQSAEETIKSIIKTIFDKETIVTFRGEGEVYER